MPTYDYRCKGCGHEFEEFQSMTAPVLKKCPKCKKNALERLIGTGAAVMFKGSGFYITDYRSESYKKAAEADKGGSSGGEASKGGDSKAGGTSESARKASEAKAAAPPSGASEGATGKASGGAADTGRKADVKGAKGEGKSGKKSRSV